VREAFAFINDSQSSMANKLLLDILKWNARVVQRWYDCSASWRRWPGKFRGVREGSQNQFWNLPDDVIRDSIFPFLNIPDIVLVESLLPRGAMAVALRARLQTKVLSLTPETADRAPIWLFHRKISPRKIIIKANVIPDEGLQFLLFIMQETHSVVVESHCIATVGMILGVMYSGTEHLRELDLRNYTSICDELLKCIRQKLTGLKLLHFALGPLCSIKAVAATLEALPLLRDFGMHHCRTYFTEQQGNMIAVRCRNLTSLTLSYLSSTPSSTGFLTEMAPNLNSLVHLEVPGCNALYSEDALALARYCGGLQRLVLAQSPAAVERGFTDSLAQVMQQLPRLQYLDVRFTSSCRDALIVATAQHCAELRELHINGCRLLTDASVRAFVQYRTPLTLLRCAGCPLVTYRALKTLLKANPTLRIYASVHHTSAPNAAAGGPAGIGAAT
jgi:hypothetical protein